MVIAINIADYLEENFYRRTLLNTFSRIAAENPNDSFIIISKSDGEPLIASANIKNVRIKHAYKATAVNWLGYQVKLSLLLKKESVDLFITQYILSTRLTKIPQVLLLPSVEYISDPSYFSGAFLSFNKKHIASFINRSKLLITSSKSEESKIEENYKIKSSLILPQSESRLQEPIDQPTDQHYAVGHPYFFCIHSSTEIDGVTNVLKSFSLFKKRLKSSMRLLISVNNSSCETALKEILKTYKYREDVRLINSRNGEEQAKVMKDSYAVIISSIFADFEDVTNSLIESRPPVIAIDLPSLRYLFNDTALYFQAGDPSGLSDKLMMLYKDERLAKQLADKHDSHPDKNVTSFQQFWLQLQNALV